MDYIKKHSKFILSVILLLICFILYFINMGEYPLIDTDETKYVSIARDMINANDWINLKLNGNNFFENPPLLFWLINISCIILGKISVISARIPISIICSIGMLFLFISVSRILTKSYALIITLIMMTSFGFLVFSRLATTDMIFCITAAISILFAYLTILSNMLIPKYILWIGLYIFSALAVLTGGIFGIIPLISTFAIYIFAGKLKKFFTPVNIIPGLIIFCIIVSPWFLLMLNKYGLSYIKEYFYIYDLSRNISIKNIFYSVSLFILGFLPWSFSCLWIIGSKFKDIINSIFSYFKDNSQDKLKEKWDKLKKVDKFLSVNTITFFTAFIFAVLFGAKFTYLILFLTLPAACISGYYWYEYLFRKEHDKSIFFATIIPNLLFITCSFIALFGHNYINKLTITGFNFLILPLIIIFFIIPLIAIFSVILKGRIPAFISNLILMISLSFVLTPGFFNFITINSGEADLIKFAIQANKDNVKLSTFMQSKKYSLVYYFDDIVDFHDNKDFNWLKNFLTNNKEDYVIIEIKDLYDVEAKEIKYMLLDAGKRYCMVKNLPITIEKQLELESEPEINIY